MECNKNCNFLYGIIGIIIGIVAGVAVGIVYSLGLIPITINLIIIALAFSIVALGILLATLIVPCCSRECIKKEKCVCSIGKILVIGIIGTFLASTISLTIGVATVSTVAAIFVGLTAFFFVVTIILITWLFICLIKNNCDYYC